MSDWMGNDRKMRSRSNFSLRLSKRSLNLVRGFYLNVVLFEKFGFDEYSSDRKLTVRNVGLFEQRQKNDVTQQLQTEIF